MGDRLIDVLDPMMAKVPRYKKVDAAYAAKLARGVVVRLTAMKRAKTHREWRDLQSALRFDMHALELHIQTL